MRGLVIYFALIFTIDLVPAEDSYSFLKFSGPVSGEVAEVVVPGSNPHYQETKIDYVAKPDYSFHYGVQDGKTGNSHTHQESRDGDAVHGEYRVLQSDGKVRIVRYTAHPHTGFQATVEYADMDGKHEKHEYKNNNNNNNEQYSNNINIDHKNEPEPNNEQYINNNNIEHHNEPYQIEEKNYEEPRNEEQNNEEHANEELNNVVMKNKMMSKNMTSHNNIFVRLF